MKQKNLIYFSWPPFLNFHIKPKLEIRRVKSTSFGFRSPQILEELRPKNCASSSSSFLKGKQCQRKKKVDPIYSYSQDSSQSSSVKNSHGSQASRGNQVLQESISEYEKTHLINKPYARTITNSQPNNRKFVKRDISFKDLTLPSDQWIRDNIKNSTNHTDKNLTKDSISPTRKHWTHTVQSPKSPIPQPTNKNSQNRPSTPTPLVNPLTKQN